jgi:hypothetical protein
MNTRTLWMGAVVLVLAAGCNRSDTRTGNAANDADRQAKITLTGCLQPGEQGLASREPNSASRSAEGVDQFVLADAKMPTDTIGRLYILEGEKSELSQHVGQQVEVTGEAKGSADANQANAQRFEVASVRMIAERCSGI